MSSLSNPPLLPPPSSASESASSSREAVFRQSPLPYDESIETSPEPSEPAAPIKSSSAAVGTIGIGSSSSSSSISLSGSGQAQPSPSYSKQDPEPPPPYTEALSPLDSFVFTMAAAGGSSSIITQVQEGGRQLQPLGGQSACTLRSPTARLTVDADSSGTGEENLTLDLRYNSVTIRRGFF